MCIVKEKIYPKERQNIINIFRGERFNTYMKNDIKSLFNHD